MKKRLLIAMLTMVLAVGVVGLTACGGTEYEETDLSGALTVYNSIQDYSVSGSDTTVKSKVKIAQDKDAYMEITAVISPHATAGAGSAADNNAYYKTITVAVTGTDKAAYETALVAKDGESTVEYNNPKKLEGKAIGAMREGRDPSQATSSVYEFVTTEAKGTADTAAVGAAAVKAMGQVTGYYRYIPQLKTAFGDIKVKANKIDVSTSYTSTVELITASTTAPEVKITNVWELEDSYIIAANSSSTSHEQEIMIMLQIGKSDDKIKKAIAPYYHVSEYHSSNVIEGNSFVYVSTLRANLAALIDVKVTNTPFAGKGQTGSITEIDATTKATLTTNTTTNAVNRIIDYYLNVIKA